MFQFLDQCVIFDLEYLYVNYITNIILYDYAHKNIYFEGSEKWNSFKISVVI